MKHVEIKVYLIGKSSVDGSSVHDWLQDKGVSDEGIGNLLNSEKTDAETLVESAGRRCYMSYEVGLNPNVSKVRKDIAEYIENILKVGHGSILEHAYFTFAIENVSRVFTGEMNRHRAGMAISEGSMRYIRYEDIPFWMPISIRETEGDYEESTHRITPIGLKKSESRRIFNNAFTAAEEFYTQLLEVWKDELSPESKFHLKKELTSMMRRIIPMGVATGGVWTGNIRALRHICNMRCDEAAEEEICLVANAILEILQKEEPNFFGDFQPNEKGFYRPKYPKV